MTIKKLYPPIANSPETYLAATIDSEVSTIEVIDGSKLLSGPGIAVIGAKRADAETITYETRTGNTLYGVIRGVEGSPRSWNVNTPIARAFTAYDLSAIQELLTFKGALICLLEDYELSSEWEDVVFDHVAYNHGGLVSQDGNGLIIPGPLDGRWVVVKASIRFDNSGGEGTRSGRIHKNGIFQYEGRAYQRLESQGGTNGNVISTAPLKVESGDEFKLNVTYTGDGPVQMHGHPSGANTWFSIEVLPYV